MVQTTALFLAAAATTCSCKPLHKLVQVGILPPDPGPKGWKPSPAQKKAAAVPSEGALYDKIVESLTRSSLQKRERDRIEDVADANLHAEVKAAPSPAPASSPAVASIGSAAAPSGVVPFPGGPHHKMTAPFGSETVARHLTKQAIDETNKMIDQMERAQQAEVKRSAHRALTRLRGAASSAYDEMATGQMGNIHNYAAKNPYRKTYPQAKHLAEEEKNIETWAFPGGSAAVIADIRISSGLGKHNPVSLATSANHTGVKQSKVAKATPHPSPQPAPSGSQKRKTP